MSCHDIGRGMNSVVEVILEMYDADDLDLKNAKKLIRACRRGVHWCDGNESEATECMYRTRCDKCLREFEENETTVDLWKYDDLYCKCREKLKNIEAKFDIVGIEMCEKCAKALHEEMKAWLDSQE